MKKCCCCIPVLAGAIVLTILAFLISSMYLGIYFPYLLNFDVETFNPIEKYLDGTLVLLEKKLIEFGNNTEVAENVVKHIREYIRPTVIGLTVVDCLSAFFNLTALMGYACKKSTFLLPNLFMQMFNLIIGLLVLSGLCVLSGFVHLLSCAVLSGLTLIIGGWMIYYWIVLFKAYQRVSKSLFGVYQDSDDDSFFEMTPDMTYRF